ncbi:MAG: response regulator [Clostridiaceae bacterium]
MLKVLIVEDEEIIRKGLIHTIDWLKLNCIIVGEASDGLEGLRLIEEKKPDLVIADIKMPVMNGIEMLETALKEHKFHSIILTSYSEFEYAKQAISLKVFEYLLKPVDEDKLAGIIENVRREVSQERVMGDIIEKTRTGTGNELNLVDLDIYIFTGSKVNYYVSEALKQIRLNYHGKISIESIAAALGVSPSYLSRKFRDTTSQTFLDILNKYRVQKAIELLNTGKYRVYEISEMTGFSEYKHFCNVFKKYTHTSPTELVKSSSCIIHRNL